jgi:serine/threonine-protein kinase
VNCHLAGRGQELKEYVIGLEVFDRSTAHDPRLDPIVRVEARRLRTKLRAFYESDGAHDPVLIEYPRGTYVPQVRWRPAARPLEIPALIAVMPFASAREESCTSFAEGLTRELMHELEHCVAVRVLGADSHRARARIEALLTGTVDCAGPHLRVTAELLSTGSSQNLWSAAFQSACRDPQMAQKQIAFATAQALAQHFRPVE